MSSRSPRGAARAAAFRRLSTSLVLPVRPRQGAVAAAVLSLLQPAWSQAVADPAIPTLAPVTVSASGLNLGEDDMSTPVSVLEGDALVLRRGANLGDTLAGEPGVSASHFGAGASRPIIRGMDGPRVKMLADGVEIHDASTISPDHAVTSEPLLARQIEVLRGPSALIHGGGAVGGVVNVLDNRIPTRRPENGFEGSVELQGRSGAREAAAAFDITSALTDHLILHLEGSRREAKDYRVGKHWSGGQKVPGSDSANDSFSAGLSWVGSRGYIGLAYSTQSARYGLPGHSHAYEGCHPHGTHLHCGGHGDHGHGHEEEAHGHEDHDHDHGDEHGHEEVHAHADEHDHDHDDHAHGSPWVKLRTERVDLRGEYLDPLPGFTRARVRAAVTRYKHDEIEGSEISTTFRNKAHEGRIELEHQPIAGWRGLIGWQGSQRRFSAQGEEAYVAPTDTKRHALFVLEEKRFGDLRVDAALRHEWQRIDVDSLTQRDTKHRGTSFSTGAQWRFQPGWSLGGTFSHSSRLPTAEELYANGIHMATSTYELGNDQLRKETSRNIDLTLAKTTGDTTFSVTGFHNRVKNYIYANTLDAYERFQLIEYAQRDATFTGVEAKLRQQLGRHAGVTVFGDYVRAKLDADAGGNRNLPRIPAQRVGVRLDGSWQGFSAWGEVVRTAAQRRIADYESVTPGYTVLNLGASYRMKVQRLDTLFYVRADNLTDKLAFAHTSFIKDAAPLRGRSVTVGARVSF